MSTSMNLNDESHKLVNLISSKKDDVWISFEFFPPRTAAGVELLFETITKLSHYKPLFVDFTWGAGGSTSDLTLDLCTRVIKEHGLVPNMHMTCTGLSQTQILDILTQTKERGIKNILALRGDPPQGQDTWIQPENGLTSALELLKFIKQSKFCDDFCLGAAGYPEGHPNTMTTITHDDLPTLTTSELSRYSSYTDTTTTPNLTTYMVCKDNDYIKEMIYLKQKVDNGATFIITQMFFDINVYVNFIHICIQYDIHIPIIPGIMLIGSYPGFQRMIKMCKTRVPDEVVKEVENLKNNEEELKLYGIKYATNMIRTLITQYNVKGIHFYTLNSAYQTTAILEGIRDLIPTLPLLTSEPESEPPSKLTRVE